jgi:mannose-6-phosphate isomerase-like protein (cupin superfamily)
MAHAGQTTENPLAGERFHWLLTEADTDGRLVRAEVAIRPRSGVLLRHIHPSSEERFEVVAGRMLVEIDGEQTLLVAGEAAVVPAGATHCWRNVGADELRFVVEVENPLGFEDMIEDVFAAARAGRMDAKGRPAHGRDADAPARRQHRGGLTAGRTNASHLHYGGDPRYLRGVPGRWPGR